MPPAGRRKGTNRAASRKPSLLVIFGAGASFDSVAEPAPYADAGWRPPLAKQLFENRRSFGEVMQRFSDALPVIGELRSAVRAGDAVEATLQRIRDRAGAFPPLERSLAALRFYLQEVVWRSGEVWSEGAHGLTNYVQLAARIEEWRYSHEARVTYVTFNYDLLLERACTWLSFGDVADYIADGNTKVFKVHGSVNWGREIDEPPISSWGDYRSAIAHAVGDLTISDRFRIQPSWNEPFVEDHRLFPALALPTQSKSLYECPEEHLDMLRAALPEVTACLAIGWRAQEQQFVSLLAKGLRPGLPMHIVTATEPGAAGVRRTLVEGGMSPRSTAHTSGFSGYVDAPRHLQALVRPR